MIVSFYLFDNVRIFVNDLYEFVANILMEIPLHLLSFSITGLFYHRGEDPAAGSATYTITYIILSVVIWIAIWALTLINAFPLKC